MKYNRTKKILIISGLLLLAISALAFSDSPYARRIYPISSIPVSCAENSIAYDMTSHQLLICTNAGYQIVTSSSGTSQHAAIGPDAVIDDYLFSVGTTGQIILNVAQNVTSIPNDFFYGQATAVNLQLSTDAVVSVVGNKTEIQTDATSTHDFLSENYVLNANFTHHGTGEIGLFEGINATIANYSTGTMDAAIGGEFGVSQPHAGTITDGTSIFAQVFQNDGTWTNAKGLNITLTKDGGTMSDFTGVLIAATVNAPITTASGITINDLSAIGTTSYNIWSKGVTAVNKFEGRISSGKFSTETNCSDSAGAAACGSAAAGTIVMDAAATTVVVSTTAVTANSEIKIQEDSSLNARLSVTCNTTIARIFTVTARTAGTSFTITSSAAPITNPACLSYSIIN